MICPVGFDDHLGNCESASRHVITGHVPYGINNEPEGAHRTGQSEDESLRFISPR